MDRVLILNEQSARYFFSYFFDGQFEDGLSVSDSVCIAAPSPQKKTEKGCLWGGFDCAQASLRRIIHFLL